MAIPLHTLPPDALNFSIGAVLGGLFSWGSEQGYYHIVALPLIALAMEGGGFSIWGSLDLGDLPPPYTLAMYTLPTPLLCTPSLHP